MYCQKIEDELIDPGVFQLCFHNHLVEHPFLVAQTYKHLDLKIINVDLDMTSRTAPPMPHVLELVNACIALVERAKFRLRVNYSSRLANSNSSRAFRSNSILAKISNDMTRDSLAQLQATC